MVDWQRSEVLAVIGLLLTLVAVGAAIHTVPEERKRRALSVLLAFVVAIAVLLLLAPRVTSRADREVVSLNNTTETGRNVAGPLPTETNGTTAGSMLTEEETRRVTETYVPLPESVRSIAPRSAGGEDLESSCGPPVSLHPPLLGLDQALASTTNGSAPSNSRTAQVSDSLVVTFGNCYRTIRNVTCDLDIVRVTSPTELNLWSEVSRTQSYARTQGDTSGPAQFSVVNRLSVSGFAQDAWSAGGTNSSCSVRYGSNQGLVSEFATFDAPTGRGCNRDISRRNIGSADIHECRGDR